MLSRWDLDSACTKLAAQQLSEALSYLLSFVVAHCLRIRNRQLQEEVKREWQYLAKYQIFNLISIT